MGWFWNSSDDDDKPKDTFSHLSPEVREFLEKEAPRKPSRNQVPAGGAPAEPAKDFDPTAYSKYGSKYADIWAQYRPLEQVEAEVRTPQMAISDVYESYKQRKGMVGRAAMENCAFEHEALHQCYAGGIKGMPKFLGGCRKENQQLERCFMSQQVCFAVDAERALPPFGC